MAEYIDSGRGDVDQTLGAWFDKNVVSGIREFRCQFGYFSFSGVQPFAGVLRDLAAGGGSVHVVLGSNSGSLKAQDVQRMLRVIEGDNASLTVVAFSDAVFHPKTVSVKRAEGSLGAVVGSGNLTGRGLGQNVEAGVVLDTCMDDRDDQIKRIDDSIDYWRSIAETVDDKVDGKSVFSISCDEDIRKLAEHGIINVFQPRAGGSQGGEMASNGFSSLQSRPKSWRQTQEGWSPDIDELIPSPPSQSQNKRESTHHFGDFKAASGEAQDVLLMKVRPRRNGRQVQISMGIHSGNFMNGAERVVDAAGNTREIGFNIARGHRNTARFEAPEMAGMNNPVAIFRWVQRPERQDDAQELLVEIFDADDSRKGGEILRSLQDGLADRVVVDARRLNYDFTVVSKTDIDQAQWYKMHTI